MYEILASILEVTTLLYVAWVACSTYVYLNQKENGNADPERLVFNLMLPVYAVQLMVTKVKDYIKDNDIFYM